MPPHKPSEEEQRAKEYRDLEKRKKELLDQEIEAFAELLLDFYEWKQQEKKKKSDPSGSNPVGSS